MPAARRALGCAALLLCSWLTHLHALDVETIRADGGLPPHIAGAFEDPAGFEQSRNGTYYVFITGAPVFRKYDASGRLLFERLMQGREMDGLLARQPTTWPRRQMLDTQVPLVTPGCFAFVVAPR